MNLLNGFPDGAFGNGRGPRFALIQRCHRPFEQGRKVVQELVFTYPIQLPDKSSTRIRETLPTRKHFLPEKASIRSAKRGRGLLQVVDRGA